MEIRSEVSTLRHFFSHNVQTDQLKTGDLMEGQYNQIPLITMAWNRKAEDFISFTRVKIRFIHLVHQVRFTAAACNHDYFTIVFVLSVQQNIVKDVMLHLSGSSE